MESDATEEFQERHHSTMVRYVRLRHAHDEQLNRAISLLRRACGVPIAFVATLNADGSAFDAFYGGEQESPTLHTALAQVVMTFEEVKVVSDVRDHDAIAASLQAQAPEIRLLAGRRIRDLENRTVGAICLADVTVRELEPFQAAMIDTVGEMVRDRLWSERLLEELRQRHTHQIKELEMLQGLFRAAKTFAIVTIDINGRLLAVNDGAVRTFGYLSSELGELSVTDLFFGETLEARRSQRGNEKLSLLEVVLGKAGTGGHERREWTMVGRGGRTFPMEVVVEPTFDEANRQTGYVLFSQDISDRKAVHAIKDDFISTVSHELRTPLTSLMGSLSLLLGGVAGPLDDDGSQLLHIAQANATRLKRLVDDILDVQKIESGRLELALRPCNLTSLLSQAIDENRAVADELNVGLQFDASQPTSVVVDAGRIMQVFANLLSNAIKFSPDGGTVTVTVTREGARIVVRVADEGPGIGLDFHEHIFTKFAQDEHNPPRSGVKGTGLGLAIALSIVERHGGTIRFESRAKFESRARVESGAESRSANHAEGETTGTIFEVALPAPIA